MAQWHEFGIHAMEKQGNSSNLLNLQVQEMNQEELVLTPEEDAEIDKLLNKLFDMAVTELQEERASANS